MEWRIRYQFLFQSLQAERHSIERELRSSNLLPNSRKRLEKLLAAKKDHETILRALLEPIGSLGKGSYDFNLAMRCKLPEQQSLTGYYTNIIRDWCWGEKENQASVEIILKLLGERKVFGELVILGAGACRLAYDLVQHLNPSLTIAIDINPLLLIVASKMIRGDSLSLYEFPIAPRTLSDVAHLRQCRAPHCLDGNFFFCLADAMTPPFHSGRCKTVLTPWFIDVIPQDLRSFAPKINNMLANNGLWINSGPLGFQHKTQSLCYSWEEIIDIVEKSGFKIIANSTEPTSYMNSPASTHSRIEEVFSFIAEKVVQVPIAAPFEYLPRWIWTPSDPVPENPEFYTLGLAGQIASGLISLIDGKRSISEMAKLVAQEQNMGLEEAQRSLQQLFTSFYERSLLKQL